MSFDVHLCETVDFVGGVSCKHSILRDLLVRVAISPTERIIMAVIDATSCSILAPIQPQKLGSRNLRESDPPQHRQGVGWAMKSLTRGIAQCRECGDAEATSIICLFVMVGFLCDARVGVRSWGRGVYFL